MQIHTSAHTHTHKQKWRERSCLRSFLWHSLAGPHPSCSIMPDGGWSSPRGPCPTVPTRCQYGKGSPWLYLPQWRDCHLNNRPSHCLSCQENPHPSTKTCTLSMLRPIVIPLPNGVNLVYTRNTATKLELSLEYGQALLLLNAVDLMCQWVAYQMATRNCF